MRRVYFFLSSIIFLPVLLNAYDWPIKEDTVQHVILAVMGECRDLRDENGVIIDSIDHFHRGIDINAPCSTKVYTIEGDTCYIDRVNGGYGSGINIGHFRYYHMVIRDTIQDSTWVGSDSLFAKTDSADHVHLQEADRELTAPGASANNAKWLNLLRDGAMTPFADSTRPHIDSIKFYRQAFDSLMPGMLDGKVDVLAVAGDTRTDSTGHSAGGNCSVYRIGYEIRDTLSNVIKPLWEKIKFDTIPSPPNASQLLLTYGSGSTMSHFRYWVSNDPFNPDFTLRNWYWNTKQKTGQPDSVDAESLEVAKFKDGHYWVKVIAADIRNNADTDFQFPITKIPKFQMLIFIQLSV